MARIIARRRALAGLNADGSQAANEMTDMMFKFLMLDRRGRIALRNRVESSSEHFDWSNLGRYYAQAHEMALAAVGAEAAL